MDYKEDSYYITQILQGNSNAYFYLVEKYKRMAYTLALKLVLIPEDAEEIAQDAFVKAYKALPGFKGESKFSTWLYKIVYNTSIASHRKKKLNIISYDEVSENSININHTDDLINQLSREEQKNLINEAIDKLSPNYKALVTLYYLNESTVKDIAIITGDSESNVKIKLFRARKKLWDLLNFHFKDKIIVEYEE